MLKFTSKTSVSEGNETAAVETGDKCAFSPFPTNYTSAK